MRRLIACLLLLTLTLVGCGKSGSDSGKLSDVKVTGAADKKPTVEFDQPFTLAKTERTFLTEGDGETVKVGDKVSVNYVGINGTTGKEFDSSFDRGTPTEFTLAEGQLIKGFVTGLEGAKVGSRVLVGIPPEDGYGEQGSAGADIKGTDTLLFVIDVKGTRQVLSRAEGTPVEPTPGNPTVTLDDKGVPTVTVPKGPPPSELVISPLIQGTGAKLAEGQTATVNYTVVVWSTGKVMESSWEKGATAPLSLGSGQLLPGLEAALKDRPVGSQLLVVVPQPDGVGAQPSETESPSESASPSTEGVTKPDALIFVIDILDASSS